VLHGTDILRQIADLIANCFGISILDRTSKSPPSRKLRGKGGAPRFFCFLLLGFQHLPVFVAVIYGLRFHGGEIGPCEAVHDFACA
jgi:hypothetical protein